MPNKITNLPTALRQALLSVLLIFSPSVQAQTTGTTPAAGSAQAANASDTEPDKNEVVRLSPFEVHSGTNEGYIASETMSGSRVKTKIFDVPASVSVITRDLLDDMGAVDPWQALSKSAPAVTTYGAPGVFAGATIRGFRAQFWAVDGATSASVGPTSNFNLDGLEIIKGPSALLYGPFGAYGGYINMMPKWARRNPINKIEVSVGTDSFYSGMIDVGYQALKDDRLQFRVVLGDLNYDRPGFKGDYTHSFVFAPSLTYDISPKVKLKTRAEYNLRDYRISSVPLDANGVPIRGLIPSNYFPGSHSEDMEFQTQTMLTGQLSDEWGFKFQFVTEFDHPKTWLGGFANRTTLPAPGNDTVTIYNSHGDYCFKQWTMDMSVAWDKVDFGPGLGNHLVFSTTINNWTNQYRWNANTSMAGLYPEYQTAPWTTFSLLNPPAPNSAIAAATATGENNLYQPYNTQWLGGIMGTDTFEMFNGKLKLNVGTRYNYDERYFWSQSRSTKGTTFTGNPGATKVNTIFLWRYGAVYQPTKNVGFYYGHDEGYLAVGAIFKFDGSPLVPEQGKNDEVGLKIDNLHALGGNFYGSVAYFKLAVDNKWRADPDPAHAGFFIQDGHQENNGWDAQLGYTSDDKKLSVVAGLFNADGPTTITGARASFVPKETLNLWVRYNLTPAFAFGGGYKRQGDSIDGTAKLTAPAFDSWDGFMEYRQKLSGRRMMIYRLGMTNITDGLNMYFLSSSISALLEDGRQTKLTATYVW
ncbi:MAG: TonB-dependent receptor plug domain-containing protein [Verrucomicrobia bacterium]|nr:TonB-dependent receptor plug domain-containing protein [Verrucomicrobiota bacterium]